jgi:hypothetical protein
MNSDLLRQRRNLILICSGLLLFDFAKVTVTRISIMGTELLVGDARVICYFAWAMWGYFLIRYYQYLRAESDLGIYSSFKSRFEGLARPYVFQQLNKGSFAGSIEFKMDGLRWRYSIKEYELGELKETQSSLLPFLRTLWWVVRSLFYVAVHTPKATDHVLPFVLAIAAPVVSALRLLQTSG